MCSTTNDHKIEKADVADSSPIDVNKVAERLDRIAELQRSLDDEFLQEQPTEEVTGEVIEEMAKQYTD